MLSPRGTPVAVLAAALVVLGASPAGAQTGMARRLGSPAGEQAAPAEAELPVPAPAEQVDVPEPPGSHQIREDEIRYPVPTAEAAARAAEEPSIRIPSRITTRLRSLDANLQVLGARGGGNIVNAVLSLLTGGLAITLGALRSNPTDETSIYLYVYGGTAAVRGVLDFVLTPNAQGAAITYQHMPMTNAEEVRARLAYGEAALAGLAEQSLIARVLDASLNMAAGVIVVPIFLAPKGFTIGDPLDYFVLIGAGVSIISGIITLASTSPAEQRWSAYQQLRERLRQERSEEREQERDGPAQTSREDDDEAHDAAALLLPPPRTQLHVSAAPSPHGAFAGLSLTF